MPEQSRESTARVTVIVLAAGASSRMGQPKQLVKVGRETLLARAVSAALMTSAASTMVVIGAEPEAVRRELRTLPVEIVQNPDWAQGLSSSIRCAVDAFDASTTAALFMTCDQPLVTGTLLQHLIDRFIASRDSVVACAYAGTLGIPALFPRKYFPALRSLSGDAGAKSLIMNPATRVIEIPFPQGSCDIDTFQDLQSAKR